MDELTRKLREYYQSQRMPRDRIEAIIQDSHSPALAPATEIRKTNSIDETVRSRTKLGFGAVAWRWYAAVPLAMMIAVGITYHQTNYHSVISTRSEDALQSAAAYHRMKSNFDFTGRLSRGYQCENDGP